MPKVTVIIPIYGVEKYIERCATSLFKQTLDDIEYIFIDDCSPDNSVNILKQVLEKYPHRQKQTTIYSMPTNSGLAAVRRHGINSAGGYIIHCDSDDYVDTTLYETMYNEAISKDADIVVCDYIEEFGSTSVRSDFSYLSGSPKEFLKTWYSNTTHMSCCNKLIKKSVYYNNKILPWDGLNMWEDNGLVTRLFYYAKKMVYVDGPVYHYNRFVSQSISLHYNVSKLNQMISVAEKLTEFFQTKEDAHEYEKTVWAFQFLSKWDLLHDSYKDLHKFYKIFPESNRIMSYLNVNKLFTARNARIRFFLAQYHLYWIYITFLKFKRLVRFK